MIAVVPLVAAFALVPVGLLFGIVARIVLARRRTWAKRNVPAAIDGRAQQASAAVTDQQLVDRVLHLVLIGAGLYLVALTTTSAALESQGFVFGSTTALGSVLLAADGVGILAIGVVLIAIPVAAVLITRQIRDRAVLLGEAFALANRSDGYRRIRTTRALSWSVSVAYAIGAVVAVGTTLPTLG